MTDRLHYPGKVDLDTERLYGPDMHGARYRATSLEYDAAADRSTVCLRPCAPAELAELAQDTDVVARREQRQRITELFGGDAA